MPLSKLRDRERKRLSRLDKEYTGNCTVCGYKEHPEILIRHHSDGDRANNDNSNLIKLCPNCHSRRHSPNGVVSFTLNPVQPKMYNPYTSNPGDTVLVRQGRNIIETVMPELDADGNIIPA